MNEVIEKINYHFELDPSILPDLVSKSVPKEEAAKQLYQALREQAKKMGFDPDSEVFMTSDYENYEEICEGQIWVCFEAGPYDWGVGYSIGSHPSSYDMMSNPQDWYLETYYGFDVIFADC
tara:strand:- start:308 stop:670 length:363 start_codon:yes stop_codon:yes gene_type:complete